MKTYLIDGLLGSKLFESDMCKTTVVSQTSGKPKIISKSPDFD